MTTIFITSLTQLVSARLKIRWNELNAQLTAYDYFGVKITELFHSNMLSKEQAQIVADLEKEVIQFAAQSEGSDKTQKDKLKELIKSAQKKVEQARGEHKAGATSATITCLEALNGAIDKFYEKLEAYPFRFFEREYIPTPEYVVYQHACSYLGNSIFHPDKHSNSEIKKKKEAAVHNRLNRLEKAIKPEYTLEQQKDTTTQVLRDLSRDNYDIVKPTQVAHAPISLGGVTFFNIPIKLNTSSLGNLHDQILLAEKAIKAMTQKTSACLQSSSSGQQPAAQQQSGAPEQHSVPPDQNPVPPIPQVAPEVHTDSIIQPHSMLKHTPTRGTLGAKARIKTTPIATIEEESATNSP